MANRQGTFCEVARFLHMCKPIQSFQAFVAPNDRQERQSMLSHAATVGLMITGIALAAWMLTQVDWANTVNSLADITAPDLIVALLATCLAFVGLATYDVVAVRHLGLPGISAGRAATAGAVAYGVSNFVGLPWLTGALVRKVFYRNAGINVGLLMTVVLASWIAFWITVAAIVGIVLALDDRVASMLGMPIAGTSVGIALLSACAVLMIWLSRGRKIALGAQILRTLPMRVTLLQCMAALMDLIGSATVLYIFLPDGVAGSAASFFCLFVVAVGLGVVSHVPAGLGAFEGTIVLGLHADGQGNVAAGLIVYRAFRTVLPFLIASGVLCVAVLANRNQAKHAP